MTCLTSNLFRPRLAVAAFAVVALACAAPASATVDYTKYPSAVAYDAAEVMAKFGGVVIDVNTLFPGDNRSLNFIGCGVTKRDHSVVPADEEGYNFTRCEQDLDAAHTLPIIPPVGTEPPPIETIIERTTNYPQ